MLVVKIALFQVCCPQISILTISTQYSYTGMNIVFCINYNLMQLNICDNLIFMKNSPFIPAQSNASENKE